MYINYKKIYEKRKNVRFCYQCKRFLLIHVSQIIYWRGQAPPVQMLQVIEKGDRKGRHYSHFQFIDSSIKTFMNFKNLI